MRHLLSRSFGVWMAFLAASGALLAGCGGPGGNGRRSGDGSGPLAQIVRGLSFDDPLTPAPFDGPIALNAARNETVSFALQLEPLPKVNARDVLALRLGALQVKDGAERIEPTQYAPYQVLAMPVDLNRAGFVRHAGLLAAPRHLPRALLPLTAPDATVNLASLRDPAQPLKADGHAAGAKPAAPPGAPAGAPPVQLWVDLVIPPTTKPGEYQASIDLLLNGTRIAAVPVVVKVADFLIPDERHLNVVGRLEWNSLVRQYPEFEAVQPQLLNRTDKAYQPVVDVLDQIVKLAQQHRTVVVVPKLQPIAKWSSNLALPPEVSWADFDTVTRPWLKGEAFADHVPLGYWPLPAVDRLENFDAKSRAMYWAAAAAHFDQYELLPRAPLNVEKPTPGRAGAAESLQLSAEAARLLAIHPRLRITVPLEDEQLQFKSDANPALLDPAGLDRVVSAAPGLIWQVPSGNWPQGLKRPSHWLRTDLAGLVPYVGAGGDEHDVRLWAWLAFLRDAQLIQWPSILPSNLRPDQPADPNEMIWFYPGRWFGVDGLLPTVQLKYLRRAQQDYEYLLLARQRGEVIRALVMARLMTKPVMIAAEQLPDPTYALMCGTTDPATWTTAQELLTRSILLRPPGQAAPPAEEIALNGETLRWAEPQERPLMIARTAQWGWGIKPDQGGNWVDLRLGLDVYNAADQRLVGNLQWVGAANGWEFRPQPVPIPLVRAINTFNVRRFEMDASINLDRLTPEGTPGSAGNRKPIELTIYNELTGRTRPLQAMLPVAISDRRIGLLKIDGSLDEWAPADALHSGQLVRMFNRPAMQQQELQLAETPSQIFSGWSQNNFYLAFLLNGVSPQDSGAGKNFIDYQFRRAWGEDLAEILAQAVYVNGDMGPVLHIVVKPRGQVFIERRLDPKQNANPWQAVVGEEVRYAYTNDSTVWRGEVAIPWDLINDQPHKGVRPSLLRFNFVQHRNANGESSSWAGPIDFGRDESFMGLLYIRDPGARR